MLRFATAPRTVVFALCLLVVSAPTFAATFTVTNTADSGAGSLRAAMTSATSGDRIEFAIPGSGPHTIQPLTTLPAVTGVVIDGRTQPGYATTPQVTIDGTLGAETGLIVYGGTVQALAVTRMRRYGIETGSATILDCHIGVDASGMIARGNGIGVLGTGGTIRGNLVSGNRERGVSLAGVGLGYGSALVEQNRFGTDVTGTRALAATTSIHAYIHYTQGRAVTFTNNVVGGGGVGVQVDNAQKVTISRNHIGVSKTGTQIRNRTGVQLAASTDLLVSDNVIADNTIGIQVLSGLRNLLLDNVMTRNGLGISLKNEFSPRPTPNDDTDEDTGANNLVNYPVISTATSLDGTTTIAGTLHSVANRTFTIELFQSPSCNASGHGEGFRRLASFDVTTDSAGNASFNQTLTRNIPAGEVITATSTSALEGTSEFSRCKTVEGRGQFVFRNTSGYLNEGGSAIQVVVQRINGANGAATVSYATAAGSAKAGSDFVSVNGTLSFADGEIEKTIPLQAVDDAVYEGTQTFSLNLTGSSGAPLGVATTFAASIIDDERLPTLFVKPVSKKEGDSGLTDFEFIGELSVAAEAALTYAYSTFDGYAYGGEDYVRSSGTFTFAPGKTRNTVVVHVKGDTRREEDEWFYFSWNTGSYWTNTQGMIVNDDAPPTVQIDDVTVSESGATAVLTISVPHPVSAGVYYQTTAGSAKPLEDFSRRSGFVSFSSQTSHRIEIPIVNDDLTEDQEQFSITLGMWFGSNRIDLGDAKAIVTINDDDIGIGPERLALASGQTGHGVIRIGTPLASDTVFALESSATDYVRVPASVTLPAGSTRVMFEIQALKAGGAANVDVTIPASLGGGSSRIRVTTYQVAQLTLSPIELMLLPNATQTVRATITPANTEPVRVRLEATDTVSVPEAFEIPAGGTATFEVKGVKEGLAVVTATLPSTYGSESATIGGRVIAQPTAPTILGVSPPDGSNAGGTVVEIRGALFREQCTVSFGGVPASVTFIDDQNLRAVAPPHALGTVDVAVTCGTDVATLTRAFTYRAAGAHVRSIAPGSGSAAGGTHVEISGVDFASSCWPFFGNSAAPSAAVRDPNTITATTPANAPATVDVRLLCVGSDATLRQGFTFVSSPDPAPQVQSVEPEFGAPGEIVKLTGTGFRPTDVVLFGDVAARVLDVTPTTLTVVVPDLAPGTVTISISSANATALTTGPVFTVGEAVPPRVSRVTAAAAAGAEIVLEGTHLRPSYTFAIRGTALPIVRLDPTRAVVRIPAQIAPGTYPIEIVNAAGRIAAMAPAVSVRSTGVVVSRVAANCAATDGGVEVTIEGSGFASGAAVTFDGIPAANVTVVDATRITARVPANYAGDATIAVTNTDGSGSTLTGAFRYASPFDPQGCGNTSGRTRAVGR